MAPTFEPEPMPKTRRLAASPEAIAEAADVLKRGGLVAFPTETVYGLGADATSGEAVARIYAAKDRPLFNPLIAHVADRAAALREGDFSDAALRLAEAFWPGPLTLVVPAAAGASVSALARAGLDSVALRVPGHPLALALIAAGGRPIAAPSANRSGRVSPTTADHVLADLDGRIDLVLDGGATAVGVEFDDRRLPRGEARPAAAGRHRPRARSSVSSARSPASMPPPPLRHLGCSPPITRRAPRCGSPQRRCATARPRSISAAGSPAASCGSTFRRRAISSRPRPIFSPICAGSMPQVLARSPSHRSRPRVSAKRSATGFGARLRRAEAACAGCHVLVGGAEEDARAILRPKKGHNFFTRRNPAFTL